WRFWPRPRTAPSAPESGLEPGIPPVVAALAFLLFLAENPSASAADAKEFGANSTASAAASILSAAYTGTVTEHVAQLQATFVVNATEPNQKLHLFSDEVAVQEFSSKPARARLVRESDGVAVKLTRRGETTLQLKLLVKLGGD